MTDDLKAPERLCYVNCGLPDDQCACYRLVMGRNPAADRIATLEAALADMTQQRDAAMAGAVKIKPLIWDETHEDRGDELSEHNGGYEADSAFGVYEIGLGFGSDSYYWSVQDGSGNEIGSFDDPDNAKAAAQADYEVRILSALTPDPDRMLALTTAAEAQAEARGMRKAEQMIRPQLAPTGNGIAVANLHCAADRIFALAAATEAAAMGGV